VDIRTPGAPPVQDNRAMSSLRRALAVLALLALLLGGVSVALILTSDTPARAGRPRR